MQNAVSSCSVGAEPPLWHTCCGPRAAFARRRRRSVERKRERQREEEMSLDPATTLNPAKAAYDSLATSSYKGPYGEVVTTQRPPHRQFPQQAWGLQTVRAPI